MTEYILEIWNPITNRYQEMWRGSEEYAKTMFNKPYHVRHTRRLIKQETNILYKEKAGSYLKD